MNKSETLMPSIHDVAHSIEADIVAKGLKPGQPYLTAREMADQLGVYPHTANRALVLLAEKGVVTRRAGVGTFIGQEMPVHLDIRLLARPDSPANGPAIAQLAETITRGMPSCDLRIDTMPSAHGRNSLMHLLDEGGREEDIVGIVIVHWRGRDAGQAHQGGDGADNDSRPTDPGLACDARPLQAAPASDGV